MKPQTTKKNKAKKCDICEKLIKGYKKRFINLFYDNLIISGNYHLDCLKEELNFKLKIF